MAKAYKLKVSGTNAELLSRIYTYLKMSTNAILLQALYRGHLRRRCNRLRGPAFIKRSICSNTEDFLTGDEMSKIPTHQFISYTAEDGFVYGFDIIFFYNLCSNTPSDEHVKNPYTRSIISNSVFRRMKRLVKIEKNVYKNIIDVTVERKEETNTMTLSDRVNRLFMEIDTHGHYSCSSWFNTLDKNNSIRLIQELADIFMYRAALTHDVRRNICPSDPFCRTLQLVTTLAIEQDLDVIKEKVIKILELVVNSGTTQDYRALGVIYVLQAFTLVNMNARTSMPWLYEAVAYS